MTPEAYEQWMLMKMRVSILRAEIRLAGMRAENEQRTRSGLALAYVEDQFVKIIDEEGISYNDVTRAFQEAQ